jgi:hypothetical protein
MDLRYKLRMKSICSSRGDAFLILFLVVSFLASSPASADDKEAAKARFKEGIALFGEEKYEIALDAFEASYQLRPNITVLYNIGMCKKALSRHAASIATFQKFLASEASHAKEKMRREAEAAIAEMLKLVGRIEIDGAPDQAEVRMDGEVVGQTPLDAPLIRDPGRYTVTVAKEGYVPLEEMVTVEAGQEVVVSAALAPAATEVVIDCPEDAAVQLDGALAGGCPFKGEVAPGTHEIVVTAPRKRRHVKTLNVERGRTATLTIHLEEEVKATPAPAPRQEPELIVVRKERSGLLAGGIVSTVLGISGISIGIFFTYKWNQHFNDTAELADKANDARQEGNLSAYTTYVGQYEDAKEKWENTNDPQNRAGMIAGYTAGGVLTLTGIALLVLHRQRIKKEQRAAKAIPTPGGMAVRF